MTRRWPSPAEVARLRVAVEAMPEPRRSVYLLSARDGLDYSAIADRLDIEVLEVERLLAEALVDLIAAIDGDDEVPPTLQYNWSGAAPIGLGSIGPAL